MYLDFYNLKEYPFAISCDARFFYESAVHREALANMLYTIEQRKGMVLVSGEVGAGKTFLGNMLAKRLGVGATTVLVAHPPRSSKQLLRAVALRCGLQVNGTHDVSSLADALEEYLERVHRRGRTVALIVDEAQDLTPGALEELRLMWNWEREGQRLLQIVLIGQPELRDILLEPRWEALRQRIVLSYHLGPLSASDTAAYISHRLGVASDGRCLADFTAEAVRTIHEASDGIPRLINTICDNSLLAAYAKGVYRIYTDLITEILRDMTCWNAGIAQATPSGRPDTE
jgi:general secretion pathway protein A